MGRATGNQAAKRRRSQKGQSEKAHDTAAFVVIDNRLNERVAGVDQDHDEEPDSDEKN
jgi:hypothetical protein